MPEIAGLLLAGGQSRRMGGGDKSLMKLGGETLLTRILARVRPQVGPIVLNVNGDPERFASFDLPIAQDVVEGFAGPLAGVLTGLEWARVHAPQCEYIASFACDAPFLPRDLVARLVAAREAAGADLACASSGDRDHPVFGLWPVELAGALRRAVVDESLRKVDDWTRRYKLARANFSTDPVDPFFNLNSPEDVAAAEAAVSAAARL
jgi:molybdopterin-guanine dinucleotide biosynthesis protein A